MKYKRMFKKGTCLIRLQDLFEVEVRTWRIYPKIQDEEATK